MRASYYAQALHDLTRSSEIEEGKLLKHFVATVAANGHAHLLPKIVKSFERILAREEKKGTIEVISAKTITEGEVGALLKKEPFKHALSTKHRKVLRRTDDTLVGGSVVRTSTQKIDGSSKRALLDLYQSLISN